VLSDDYDAHMAAIGQAQANAELVPLLLARWPPPGRPLLFAGAGTGQLFDFAGTEFLRPHDVTFTDINARFLQRLEERLRPTDCRNYKVVVDDVEQTELEGPFSGAVLVLVLEHVRWRAAIATLRQLGVARCYVVIQENPPQIASVVTAGRPVGSMNVFREAPPTLVPRALLIAAMDEHGYSLLDTEERTVLDGKKMIGLVFTQTATEAPRR
jgi:hypothetical protein